MWVRKRLDIRWSDLASALRDCLTRWDATPLAEDVEELWSPTGDALACLSVRSGLDLWLQAIALPPGSEVLVSAITIPDMVRILEHHGLVAAPVDVNPSDLSVDLSSLQRAISPRTRAVLIAHLFGTRQPLEPIVEIAQRHNLLVAEDCAQAFAGRGFTGHPQADVAMFSFGPIKTATALAGALLRVRDASALARMRALQARYPVHSREEYARRVAKYSTFKLLSYWPLFGLLNGAMNLAGRDLNQLITGSVRGFPGDELINLIRQQSSAPLLALMFRRIAFFNRRTLARRTQQGRRLVELIRGAARCPGIGSPVHSFWVFPVLHNNAAGLIARLRAAGFDASAAHSLFVVRPPADRPELRAQQAEAMLPRLVHLPCYREMPDRELRRLADEVRASLHHHPAEASAPQMTPAGMHAAR